MSDDIEVAWHTYVGVWAPEDDNDHFTVSGDLRAPGSGMSDDANYECSDALSERGGFGSVVFDSETSCFFAYAKTREQADAVVEAIRGWLAQRDRPSSITGNADGDISFV